MKEIGYGKGIFNEDAKELVGKILFVLGIGIFIYMLFSPLSQVITYPDEYFTLGTIRLSFSDAMAITANDVHPPMHYIILMVVSRLLSIVGLGIDSLYALKLTSIMLYPIVLFISAFKLSKEYSWLTAGLFALAIGTMCDFFIHFLTVRMYGWGLLFLLLSFIFYKDLLRDFDIKSWAGLSIFTLLGVYSQYFFAIPSAVLYLLLLGYIIRNNRKQLRCWIASVAAMVLLYLPWLPTLLAQVHKVHENFWIKPMNLNTLVDALAYYCVYDPSLEIEIASILLLAAFLFIFFKGIKDHDRIENFYILSGFAMFFGSILILAVMSLTFRPVFILRYILPACAVLWLCISIIVGRIESKRLLAVIIVVLLLLSAISLSNVLDFSNDRHETGIKELDALDTIRNDTDSIVIISGSGAIVEYGTYVNSSEAYLVKSKVPDITSSMNYTVIEKSDVPGIIESNRDRNIYAIEFHSPLDEYIIKTLGKAGSSKFGVIHYKE